MSKLPLVTIEQIVRRAKNNPKSWVKGGRSYNAYYDSGKLTLLHYGTTILTLDEYAMTYSVGTGAYSASDRDAINSMFHIYGVGVRARVHYGDILVDRGLTAWTEA